MYFMDILYACRKFTGVKLVPYSYRRVLSSTSMALRSGADYHDTFEVRNYLRQCYAPGRIGEYEKWYLAMYHEFYKMYSSLGEDKSKPPRRLLQFGGGPTIFSLISAASHVQEIIFSEYTKACRVEVELWKDNKPDAYNWSQYFRYVVQQLEETSGDHDDALIREDLLRSRISSIIPCDINAAVESMLPGDQGLFDIVTCDNTIGVASQSIQEYQHNVEKLVTFLRPGGYLTVVQPWCCSYYMANGRKFYSLSINAEQFEAVIKAASLSVVISQQNDSLELIKGIPDDRKGMLFIAAQKT